MNERPEGWKGWRRWACAAALCAVAFVAMAPGLTGELLNWDDNRFVEENELIRSFSPETLGPIFSEPHFEAYHPLHLLSYCFDFAFYRLWAPGYKIHNFLLYLVCLLLIWMLATKLGLKPVGACIAVALFAVHPLHVEGVVWVTARKEPLSLALMLGAALLYLHAPSLKDRRGMAAVALFALALLTKTSTVVLPGLLLLIDVIINEQPWKKALKKVAPLAVVALLVGLYVISLWQENEMARPMPSEGTAGLAALVGKSYWHYVSKLLWPAALSPVYPIDRVGAFDVASLAGFVCVGAAVFVAWRAKDRLVAVASGWFVVALLPAANIVPVYFFVQDRYAFIATVGAALLAGRLAEHLSKVKSFLPWTLAGALTLAFASVSWAQAAHWQTSLDLWRHATAVQPQAYYGHLALGHTLRDGGDLGQAAEAYRRAIEINPSLPYARISLCLADATRVGQQRGRSRAEIDEVGEQLGLQWRSAGGLYELSGRLLHQGYATCAQLAESRAFNLRPPAASALVAAASRWTLAGQGQLALRYLQRAEQMEEPSATALEVEAQALEIVGEPDQARDRLRQSLQAEPRSEHRLVVAAQRLLDLGHPRLALLYVDVGSENGRLTSRWTEIRQGAEAALSAQ